MTDAADEALAAAVAAGVVIESVAEVTELDDLRAAFFDDWNAPWSVCRPPRPNTRGVVTATAAMILMRPMEGHLEACPMPALNRRFTTYSLTPDRTAQKQAAE